MDRVLQLLDSNESGTRSCAPSHERMSLSPSPERSSGPRADASAVEAPLGLAFFRGDEARALLLRFALEAQRLEAGRIVNELSACATAVGYARGGHPAPLERARIRLEARVFEPSPQGSNGEAIASLLERALEVVILVQRELATSASRPG
jgi:hypothetical protein